MAFKLTTEHIVAGIIGVIVIILDFVFLLKTKWFFTVLTFGILLFLVQFLVDFFKEWHIACSRPPLPIIPTFIY